ncbi:PxKF domain-containing protein [Salinibacterium sp. G-O1]|uniref:OmpL47-type beta-barrel domain-containing protein n=1 Tax=Salinibacterium sp. G-O1 TaxID=3046208 RepID=UPI0024B9C4DC|nr:PxKF domain-containing protein [Salinibacterium sp. G-O1]MDJ0335382.1 PxKF domain-containing protein [Salinibacterium sp. G-O1]
MSTPKQSFFTAPRRTHASTIHGGMRARTVLSIGTVVALLSVGVITPAAHAANAPATAVFTGGSGTVLVSGELYATTGAVLTLTVTAPSDTICLDVSGSFTTHATSTSPRSVWTMTTIAGSGSGIRSITASASPSVNPNDKCTGQAALANASYILDNTGPVVAASLTPAPNAAGWNKTATTVTWIATDSGSGIGSGPTPASSIETANGIVVRQATATDRLGNVGSGSVTVRIDKIAPTISAAETKNPDGTTTVSFTCDDPGSSGSVSGITSCRAGGSSTNSVTVPPGTTVSGTATDAAGNSTSTSVTVAAGDITPPTLTGSPTTSPNGAGWYAGDVTIRWSASDNESGVPVAPADTTISGEGAGLASTTTVTNGAGLSTTATSSPLVNIDRTAPTTNISGGSNLWTNNAVTIRLTASDNLSSVATTEYTVDAGEVHTGTVFTLSTEGDHVITFRSIDGAGNTEAVQTARVRIDTTAPTISHGFTPLTYAEGSWSNSAITVTFTCEDQGGSGVSACTAPVTTSAEGTVSVDGVAVDGAGNSASDTATVRIDLTAPAIAAASSGIKNAAGWYKESVTVRYEVSDALSGVLIAPSEHVLGEGAGQSTHATAVDMAGNSNSAGVSDINIDLTPPLVEGTFAGGWHTDDVTVDWSCTDALSGPSAQPDQTVVTGEGGNLSSTASCTDLAGNISIATVSGIMIDRSKPTTQAVVPAPLESGWYGQPISVTFVGSDNLSGIAGTYYTVDGGPVSRYEGAFDFAEEGEHTIAFWSVDGAGNRESAAAPLTVKLDTRPPTTTVINPISPALGWFVTSGIPVAFRAEDDRSGIAATYFSIDGGEALEYGEPFTAQLSTGVHSLVYWSVDLAGNIEAHTETNLVIIQVDTDSPTISGSASPAANGFGWNNTPVDVAFTCDDIGSGVVGCAGGTTLANDTDGQTIRGEATDAAGNRSHALVGPIKIDQTRPTLTGVPTTDPNAARWYNRDVTVRWVGDDALSGIDPGSQPEPSIVTGEGRNLGAGPVTILDKAGNASDDATIAGINIDRTAPGISGRPTTNANAAGWHSGEVTVDFQCTDALSGVASCPTSKLLRGDGLNQSVTSDPATDLAGNVRTGNTVGGINIDGTAPSTTSNNTCTAVNDYCTGPFADVVLTAIDQIGLSGVKEIRYSIHDDVEQVVPGSSATVRVPLTDSGAGTVRYYAVDNAGNSEQVNAVSLKWDNIAPAVSHKLVPAPNAAEWNNADVTVTFTAKDDDKGSGVHSVTSPVTVSTETGGLVVTGVARDTAGNVGSDSVTVKLDKTAPTIAAAITHGTRTASGWYNGPVTVRFTCADSLSGVALCPDAIILATNGVNHARGTATDAAGNNASASVEDVYIDQEKPTMTPADVNVAGAGYILGGVPAARCTATDSFSGLASCVVTVTGGNANGVGTHSYSAVATDNAGNTTTITGTFTVSYRFDGFLQPINDTAHQIGTSTSVFKAGSTVPVKFRLKDADGTIVESATAPVWLAPTKGGAMTAPVDETAYAMASDSGSSYKYDSSGRQFSYNWKTGSGGNYWRIGVKLDDGRIYYVNIALR